MTRKALTLLALVLAALVVSLVPPVSAADYAWSPSGCDGGRKAYEGDWYGVPGQGVYYRSFVDGYQVHWVGGTQYQLYRLRNHECGPLSWPTSGAYDLRYGDATHPPNPLYLPGEWIAQDYHFGHISRYQGLWYVCYYSGGCSRVYP